MRNIDDLLGVSLWTSGLDAEALARVASETVTREVAAGALACHKGQPVDAWIGVVDGLLKMSNVSAEGKPMSFLGVATGSWFGEGSLLKEEPRRYDMVALRSSTVAFMPKATFMWLLDTSMPFNRFVITQLNERLGQFIGMVEHDRLLGPDARLARCLAAMHNPQLYPGIGPVLPISQDEIAQLAGLSRQRTNQALQRLEQAGLLRIEYGSITVTDLPGLRLFED
ncbi:MAG: Crp/Fnr family transcriptional regulator [Betaproteobacteria bacterium]